MFLPREAVCRLTGKKRFAAQRRALDRLRIAYRVADTGEPLVREVDLDGEPNKRRNGGPRWDRIGP